MDWEGIMEDARYEEEILIKILNEKYHTDDLEFIYYLQTDWCGDSHEFLKFIRQTKDEKVYKLQSLLNNDFGIPLNYEDTFILRLLIIEHKTVLPLSIKNNKMDYKKNYLDQYLRLSETAADLHIHISPPFQNPKDIKVKILAILHDANDEESYIKITMKKLLELESIERISSKASIEAKKEKLTRSNCNLGNWLTS